MHAFLQLHACGFVYPFEHIALYVGKAPQEERERELLWLGNKYFGGNQRSKANSENSVK